MLPETCLTAASLPFLGITPALGLVRRLRKTKKRTTSPDRNAESQKDRPAQTGMPPKAPETSSDRYLAERELVRGIARRTGKSLGEVVRLRAELKQMRASGRVTYRVPTARQGV